MTTRQEKMRGQNARYEEDAAEARRLAHDVDRFVGQRIRERRLARGVTQQGLAKALGISYQQVQKYENGTNRISAGRLFVLARLLGADVADFFPGKDDGTEANRLGSLVEFSEDAVAAAKDFMALDSQRIRQALRGLLRALRQEVDQQEH
ncbi:MAG: helix-turn-helix domain-containing protein [Alphaproteobacteria bacterium]|nr:MAG: helix-turn-helix domain-containing protein [Alphaproteobacteria bacterium]